jgi:hypothetical protein
VKKYSDNYSNYDYENTFDLNLEKLNDVEIENYIKKGFIKSAYVTKTIKSGSQFEIEIYPMFSKKQKEKYKIKKSDRKKTKCLNDKNAKKRLRRLINTNFNSGDLWVTLTYDADHNPKSMDEAQRNIRNFMKRINYKRKKLGLKNAKYIYITEKRKRYHHHLILEQGLTMDEVENTWKCGRRNNTRKINKDEDGLTGLANYLAKDSSSREEYQKMWVSSKNLKKPTERKTYSVFQTRHVKKMVDDPSLSQIYAEKRYKNMKFQNVQIRYNNINHRFYIYIEMTKKNERSNK